MFCFVFKIKFNGISNCAKSNFFIVCLFHIIDTIQTSFLIEKRVFVAPIVSNNVCKLSSAFIAVIVVDVDDAFLSCMQYESVITFLYVVKMLKEYLNNEWRIKNYYNHIRKYYNIYILDIVMS